MNTVYQVVKKRSALSNKAKFEKIASHIFSSFDLILKELAFEHRLSGREKADQY
ncbi:hypothetical protein [Enterococcus mundtii]|uniref:hypothetical protein n=1 Tax=Enterococcus mundtii TaxID=53346 RepID=UPI0035C690D6